MSKPDSSINTNQEGKSRPEALMHASILDYLGEIVFAINQKYALKYLNAKWQDVMQFPTSQCIGESLFKYIDPNDRGLIKEMVKQLFADKRTSVKEVARLIKKDKSTCYVEIRIERQNVQGHKDEDLLSGLIILISDDRYSQKILEKRLVDMSRPYLELPEEEINIDVLFSVEELQVIQDVFAKATGVASVITYPDGRPITIPSNFTKLCKMIRSVPCGAANCYKSDSVIGAGLDGGPVIQPCLSSGLIDAGVPIRLGDRVVAHWMIGQVITESGEKPKSEYAKELGLDEDAYFEALNEVHKMSEREFESVVKTLQIFADSLSSLAYKNYQQTRFIQEKEKDIKQIRLLLENEQGLSEELKASEEELRQNLEHVLLLKEQLEISERHFRLLADNASDMVFLMETDGRIVFASPSVWEIIGYKPKELIDNYPSIFILDEDYHLFDGLLVHADYEDFSSKSFDIRLMKKDAEIIWAGVNGKRIYDETRKSFFIQVSLRDITERINTRMAIVDSERRFRMLFENMTNAFALHEIILNKEGKPVNYKYLDVNPAFERFINKKASDIIGKTVTEVFPGIKQLWIETFGKVALTEQAVYVENRYGDSDNTYSIQAYSPQKGQFAVVIEDITQRIIAQNALKKSEELYRALFDNISVGIMLLDRDYKVTMANGSMLNMFSLDFNQLIGEKCYHVLCKSDNMCNDCHVFNSITKGTASQSEKSFKRLDGTEFIVRSSVYPYKTNDDYNEGYIVLYEDITHWKNNEKLKQEYELARKSSEIKQIFLAHMSHEIRTPMTGILGMTDFILKTELSDQQREYLSTIKNSSETLLGILNDILDLSKIEAGRMEIKNAPFKLTDLITKIHGLFLALCIQKGISFNIYLDKNMPDCLNSDPYRLSQVITNLTSNAIKFTSEGEVSLNFSLDSVDENEKECMVKVLVKDTGIGIKAEDQSRLFKSFSQVDSSLSRSSDGTGLGLAISRNLVHLMGGEIGVESNPDVGSTFWFTFKAGYCDSIPEKESVNQTTNGERERLTGLNVLLVEDKYVNQKVISLMLNELGCNVYLAANGLEAIEIFHKSKEPYQGLPIDNIPHIDLIFMDIQMPVMDGITAVKNLREQYTALPPIIALSANAMAGDAERFIALGMDDYLSKPVFVEQLASVMLKWEPTAKSYKNNK